MNTLPRYWADMTSADFEQLDLARAVAVLPLGATEQHGPHLPLSVDTVLVDGVVRHALGHVAEGVGTAREVARLSVDLSVDMPIARAVAAVIAGDLAAKDAVTQLMSRAQRAE